MGKNKKAHKYKKQGHFCRICREYKANEKFSGRGHASHICKACHSLPLNKRNELEKANKIDTFPMDEYRRETFAEPTDPVVFSELDDALKKEVREHLRESIGEFLSCADFLPDKGDTNEILTALCEEISIIDEYGEPEGTQKKLIINNDLLDVFGEILSKVLAEFKADGVEFISYLDSLNVAITKRMKIRHFIKSDITALHRIMKKPEVMYAWEHGFHKREVKTWINTQIERYENEGYGYYAVTLKDTGKIIGQAGLIKTEINGENVVELGYIFDNSIWGQGYCTEAARACVDMAFGKMGIDKLYCTIRPENYTSIRVAERLGMAKVGQLVKTYEGKEMPHSIYILKVTPPASINNDADLGAINGNL